MSPTKKFASKRRLSTSSKFMAQIEADYAAARHRLNQLPHYRSLGRAKKTTASRKNGAPKRHTHQTVRRDTKLKNPSYKEEILTKLNDMRTDLTTTSTNTNNVLADLRGRINASHMDLGSLAIRVDTDHNALDAQIWAVEQTTSVVAARIDQVATRRSIELINARLNGLFAGLEFILGNQAAAAEERRTILDLILPAPRFDGEMDHGVGDFPHPLISPVLQDFGLDDEGYASGGDDAFVVDLEGAEVVGVLGADELVARVNGEYYPVPVYQEDAEELNDWD